MLKIHLCGFEFKIDTSITIVLIRSQNLPVVEVSIGPIPLTNPHGDEDTDYDQPDLTKVVEDILFNVVHLDKIFADEAEKMEHKLEFRS